MVLRKGSSSGQFRNYDPFSKPKDGIRTRNTIGGLITSLASLTAICLFLSQIYIYYQVDTRHSFILTQSHPLSQVISTEGGYANFLTSSNSGDKRTSTSNKKTKNTFELAANTISFLTKNRMTISIHLTFPHLLCADLDLSHDSASLSNGKFERYYGRNVLTRRVPTEYEYYRATTGATDAQARALGKSRRLDKRTGNGHMASAGCTVEGQMTVPTISGDLTFTMMADRWKLAMGKMSMVFNMIQQANMGGWDELGGKVKDDPSWGSMADQHNFTYFIHDITFGTVGTKQRKSKSSTNKYSPIGSTNPLFEAIGAVTESPGIAHTSLSVTLIPTRLERFARRSVDTYQASVGKTVIEAENLIRSGAAAPGLSIQYDFSPLAVHHVQSRENVLVFLSSLVGIVGGAFVTFGLVGRGLVSSASAVTKKVD